ncbi:MULTISPECIES: MFS transporter [Streptomyces]|uniref:MFS transporter n=1 Tax=Streptomyces TaxID=1883 RepID=UPI001E2BFDEE|nr:MULTISPECIES: MFS transporter [Streptomyces]UFQ17170.1 MFS transporter [Streptomyces huasconensis]WCL86770.1 MFS transporter [Streptomyces sp. JCM 35825]
MLRTTLRAVRGLAPELRTLFITTLLFRSGTMAFPFLAAYLVARDDYSAGQVGSIVGAYGLGALAADLAAGPVLRFVSARTVMIVGLVGNAVLVALLPFTHSAVMLIVGSLVWGFFYEAFTPAAYAETVRHSREEDRKVAFSCNRLAINVGMGIGPALGGLVFAWRPMGLFFINACVVLATAVYLTLRTTSGGEAADEGKTVRGRLVAPTVKGETRFWSIFLLALPIHLAYALPPTFLSAYVIHERGLPSYWAGTIFFVNAVAIVLFEVPLNTAMRHMSHFVSLLAGYALAASGFALMGLSTSGPALIGATLLWTAAEMIVFPALLHYVSEVSDPSVTGRNMGLYSAGVNVGLIAMPQLSLMLTDGGGPAASPWYLVGAALGVALVLIVAVRRSSYLWLTEPEAKTADIS